MMEDLYPDFYNPNYTAQKLKNKLLKQYGTSLQFWLPHAACKSELVFSSHIDLGEAVEVAFDACSSETAVLDKAASILSMKRRTHVSFCTVCMLLRRPPL